MAAEDAAAMKQLRLPADLLRTLKGGGHGSGDTQPQPVKFDMVAAVQRHLRFAQKMHDAQWLRSAFAGDILEAAISRYDMFFTLIAEHPGKPLSPTQDIDLAWHTHHLAPGRYGLYSAARTSGSLVNHSDAADKGSLDDAFGIARALFRERFGREYVVCYCGPCMGERAGGGKGLVVYIHGGSSSRNANCNKLPGQLRQLRQQLQWCELQPGELQRGVRRLKMMYAEHWSCATWRFRTSTFRHSR